MKKRINPELIHQIIFLSHVLVHPSTGKPHQLEISKRVPLSRTSVQRILANPQAFMPPGIDVNMEKTGEEWLSYWAKLRAQVYGSYANSLRNLTLAVEDATRAAVDGKPYSSKDLRFLVSALAEHHKTLALASGDVTSRTWRTEQHTGAVRHELIRIPEKDTAAFAVREGLREIGAPEDAIIEDVTPETPETTTPVE